MNEIKCLAVRQPWAWAICAGLKGIENRTWTTKHRGRIAIVASANKTDLNAYTRAAKPNKLSTSTFTLGAVIGVADLVDVEPLGPHLETNRWAFGPYCWRLANGRKFGSVSDLVEKEEGRHHPVGQTNRTRRSGRRRMTHGEGYQG